MFCPKCGKQIPDGSKFCCICGENLAVVTPVVRQNALAYQRPKKNRLPVICFGVMCMVLLCAVAFFIGSRWGDGNSAQNPSEPAQNDPVVQTLPRETEYTGELPRETEPIWDVPVETTGTVHEPVEIAVIVAQYGSRSQEWWTGFEQDFERAYPDVNLVLDVVSWNDIYTVVNSRISNSNAPDILNIDIFEDYQADDLLLPVTEYMSRETYSKFFPNFLEQSCIDNNIWAVPDLALARCMYFNADILDAVDMEVPTTWSELREVCEAIKEYDPDIYPWGVDMTTDEGQACFAYYTMGNGGGFVDAAGNWNLNSPENVEAVEFIVDMAWSGLTNESPHEETRYDLQEMFAEGQVAMMIAPGNMGQYLDQSGSTIRYGIAPIPANDGYSSRSLAVMDRFMAFDNNQSAAEMEAITAFFDYFYEDLRYTEWVTMEGFLPATRTGCRYMARQNPDMEIWLQILDSAQFYPAIKYDWRGAKSGVIDVLQEAYLFGTDVEYLLDMLQQQMDE